MKADFLMSFLSDAWKGYIICGITFKNAKKVVVVVGDVIGPEL